MQLQYLSNSPRNRVEIYTSPWTNMCDVLRGTIIKTHVNPPDIALPYGDKGSKILGFCHVMQQLNMGRWQQTTWRA
jgi:hypothetical protein